MNPPFMVLRPVVWALVTCAGVAASLVTIHLLDVRDRPTLLPVVPDSTTRVDAYSDPLPVGAVVRLGSRRFRVGEGVGLAILPDGERFVAGMADGRIGVFDIATGKRLRMLEAMRRFVALDDGRWTLLHLDPTTRRHWRRDQFGMFTLDRDGDVQVDRPPRLTSLPNSARAKVNRVITVVSPRRAVRTVDVATDRVSDASEFEVNWKDNVHDLSLDGDHLVVHLRKPGNDGHVAVLDVETGVALWSIESQAPPLAWSPEGNLWMMWADRIEVRDPATGRVIETFPGPALPVVGPISLAPACDALLLGDRALPLPGSLTRRWSDPELLEADLRPLHEVGLRGDEFVAADGRVTGDAVRVLVRTRLGHVHAFTFGDAPGATSPDGHTRPIARLAWTPGGAHVLALDAAGHVSCWHGTDGKLRWWSAPGEGSPRPWHPDQANGILSRIGFTVSGDTALISLEGEQTRSTRVRRLARLDLEDGRSLEVADEFGEMLRSGRDVHVPLRGDHLVVGNGSHFAFIRGAEMEVREIETGESVAALPYPHGLLGIDAITPNGRGVRSIVTRLDPVTFQNAAASRFASADRRRIEPDALGAQSWRTQFPGLRGSLQAVWEEGRPWPAFFARRGNGWTEFSDSSVFTTGPRGGLVLHSFSLNYARRIETSPDRRQGVLFDGEQRAVLLDLVEPRLLFAFPSVPSPVTAVAWHPDGKVLATGTKDGTILIWDVAEISRDR